MKKLIICPKASGNTYKVSHFVARNSGADLWVVNESAKKDLLQYDVIILASGIYAGHAHKNLLKWIKSMQINSVKPDVQIYVFLTWIGRGNSDKNTFNGIKHILREKGIPLEDSYMKCFGKGMGVIKSAHPNDADFKKVLSWVIGL